MKKRTNRFKPFIQKIRFKYRVSVLNENTLEESWHIRLSRFSVFMFVSTFFLATFILLTVLIFTTPIARYLPGYGETGNRSSIIAESMRTDSLVQQVDLQEGYIDIIKGIINGKMKPDSIASLDSIALKQRAKILMEKSKREKDFVDKYEKEEKLVFVAPSLIDMRTDDVLNEILDAVKRINAKRVVIDSISSMMSATMNEESVRQFLIQLTRFFKSKGITCVMNFLSGTNFGAAKGQLLATNETSLMRLSSIVDGIILLLYVERGQRVKRILNILKMRGSWHSNEIFQYEINGNGIKFGERYEE